MKPIDATRLISSEYFRALQIHYRKFNSYHEGISVIREEFEELWDEIKKNSANRDPERILEEARQLGAMAMRFLIDLCEITDE